MIRAFRKRYFFDIKEDVPEISIKKTTAVGEEDDDPLQCGIMVIEI